MFWTLAIIAIVGYLLFAYRGSWYPQTIGKLFPDLGKTGSTVKLA